MVSLNKDNYRGTLYKFATEAFPLYLPQRHPLIEIAIKASFNRIRHKGVLIIIATKALL